MTKRVLVPGRVRIEDALMSLGACPSAMAWIARNRGKVSSLEGLVLRMYDYVPRTCSEDVIAEDGVDWLTWLCTKFVYVYDLGNMRRLLAEKALSPCYGDPPFQRPDRRDDAERRADVARLFVEGMQRIVAGEEYAEARRNMAVYRWTGSHRERSYPFSAFSRGPNNNNDPHWQYVRDLDAPDETLVERFREERGY